MSERFRIEIPRWDDFQHYKDRARPTWIKDYTRQLDDAAYLELTPHQRGLLHDLRLLYAASGRQMPDNTSTASRRLGYRVTRASLDALNHAGFIRLTSIGTSRGASRASVPVEKRREEEPSREGAKVVPLRPENRDPDDMETLGESGTIEAFFADLERKKGSA